MSDNLYNLLRERFPRDLSQTFLETDTGEAYSYRDLDRQTAIYASFLTEKGLAKGDRLLAQVDKSPQALMLCLACIRAGLIFVPLNPAYRKIELRHMILDSTPSAVICRPEALDELSGLLRELENEFPHPRIATFDEHGNGTLAELSDETPPEFDPTPCAGSDVAALMYTSGTTGRPKGAMITHRNLAANITALHDTWRWRPTDVLLHSLPIFHFHGLFIACLTAVFGSTKIVFLPKFDADSVIERLPQATVFMGVPTYYTRLLEHPQFCKEVCRDMRLFISGSAPLLAQTFLAFEERTGFRVLERYGMTEAGVITSNPVDGERVAGMVGTPLPGVSLRIVGENQSRANPSRDRKRAAQPCSELPHGEVGEVEIKGDNVFSGYWRKPEENAACFTADGFFQTGDLGRWEPNGYLSIAGRQTDLVITGGLNVYPKEVELAMDQMDGVSESAVIGVPHPDFGEAVVAIVIPKAGSTHLNEASLLSQLKEVLANYKVPKRLFFTDDFPRNALGKVQKNVLRSQTEYSTWATKK